MKYLPGELRAKIQAFLTPTNVAILVASLGVVTIANGTPAGPVVDAILTITGGVLLGKDVIDGVLELVEFAKISRNARSEAEIEQAAKIFSKATTTLGVDGFLALLQYKATKAKNAANEANTPKELTEGGGGVATSGVEGTGTSAKTQLWTSTSELNSVENALKHWENHSTEFPELTNVSQYMEAAYNFLHNSPSGTFVKIRASNGDILKYQPSTNTFAVMDASGAPRTMFKPKDGLKYWLKQT